MSELVELLIEEGEHENAETFRTHTESENS